MNPEADRRRLPRTPKRVWFLTGPALASAALLILTVLWPTWIEKAFAVDPDRGDGSLEWILTSVAALTMVGFGWGARVQWRRWTTRLQPSTGPEPSGQGAGGPSS